MLLKEGISILLLAETQLTLSKAIQNLIININRTISFKCYIFHSTTHLASLVDGCFNKRMVLQWIRTGLRYSPICFYMLMRHTSFKGFSIIMIVLIHRTMVFWTELSCWCKIYSTKTAMHLCWSHSVTLSFFLIE